MIVSGTLIPILCHEYELLEMSNDLHPSIEFTMESETVTMHFLDLNLRSRRCMDLGDSQSQMEKL